MLAYDPERQWLVGVYHHLGAREDYEVYFTRFEDEVPKAAAPKSSRIRLADPRGGAEWCELV